MIKKGLWIFILIGGLCPYCFCETINIKSSALVKDELIKFTDVCDLIGFSGVYVRKLESSYLGKTPDSEQEKKITREDIKTVLRKLDINTLSITFTGSEFCLVKRLRDSEKDLLKNQIRERLVSNIYEQEEMRTIEIECTILDAEILGYKNNNNELTFVCFEPNQPVESGRFRLKGNCIDKQGNLFTVYAFVDLKLFAQVVTAKRSLSPNRLITSNDIGIERKQIFKGQEFFTSTKDIEGLKVANAIEKGTIIDSTMVKGAVLVKKRDYVVSNYKGDGFSSSVLMQSLDDGSLNDIVRIQNPISKQITYAKVVGRAEVEILGDSIYVSKFNNSRR